MDYRKDLQILRGIAVLLLVLYHLGFVTFESGFLGVDVFFVISGYLMAAIYKPDNKAEFFRKRARRLLPAYFSTVLITLFVSGLVSTPYDFSLVVNQSQFAMLFASNIGFWLQSPYFDNGYFKPLLHLWSLGIEIQFYLLVPSLYWLLRKTRAYGYWALVFVSIATCFVMVGISPKTSFFWLPFRLWEFLFGFGIAIFLAGRITPRASWVGALGFTLILLIPLLPVNIEAKSYVSGQPGLIGLAICAATAVVLLFGLPEKMKDCQLATLIERLGNWSYSIYLAHFPAIVLGLYQPFSGTLLKSQSTSQLAVVTALVVTLSALLYRFIELPLRHAPMPVALVAVAVAGVIAMGVVGGVLKDVTITEAEKQIFAASQDRAPIRCGQLMRVLHPSAVSCEINRPATPVRKFLLAGDSHADAIKMSFAKTAAEQNISVFLTVHNEQPLPQALMNEALERNVDTIVLHNSSSEIWGLNKIATLVELAATNSILVVVIMPVPVWDQHVPKAMYQHLKFGVPLQIQTLADYQSATDPLRRGLTKINKTNLIVYEIGSEFCWNTCRLANFAGKPLYFDSNHLTLTGSEQLSSLFNQIMRDIKARPLASKAPQMNLTR